MSSTFDAFITHDWGIDDANHKRVIIIWKYLKSFTPQLEFWFDEVEMEGNVRNKMVQGITNSKALIAFITERYGTKVNSMDPDDNCYFEFNFAMDLLTSRRTVPVVLERKMKNPKDWKGRLRAELGTHLYVDLTEALEQYERDNQNDLLLKEKCKEIHDRIIKIHNKQLSPLIRQDHLNQDFLTNQEAFETIRKIFATLGEKTSNITISRFTYVAQQLSEKLFLNKYLQSLDYEIIIQKILTLEKTEEILISFLNIVAEADDTELPTVILSAVRKLIKEGTETVRNRLLQSLVRCELPDILHSLLSVNLVRQENVDKKKEYQTRITLYGLIDCLAKKDEIFVQLIRRGLYQEFAGVKVLHEHLILQFSEIILSTSSINAIVEEKEESVWFNMDDEELSALVSGFNIKLYSALVIERISQSIQIICDVNERNSEILGDRFQMNEKLLESLSSYAQKEDTSVISVVRSLLRAIEVLARSQCNREKLLIDSTFNTLLMSAFTFRENQEVLTDIYQLLSTLNKGKEFTISSETKSKIPPILFFDVLHHILISPFELQDNYLDQSCTVAMEYLTKFATSEETAELIFRVAHALILRGMKSSLLNEHFYREISVCYEKHKQSSKVTDQIICIFKVSTLSKKECITMLASGKFIKLLAQAIIAHQQAENILKELLNILKQFAVEEAGEYFIQDMEDCLQAISIILSQTTYHQTIDIASWLFLFIVGVTKQNEDSKQRLLPYVHQFNFLSLIVAVLKEKKCKEFLFTNLSKELVWLLGHQVDDSVLLVKFEEAVQVIRVVITDFLIEVSSTYKILNEMQQVLSRKPVRTVLIKENFFLELLQVAIIHSKHEELVHVVLTILSNLVREDEGFLGVLWQAKFFINCLTLLIAFIDNKEIVFNGLYIFEEWMMKFPSAKPDILRHHEFYFFLKQLFTKYMNHASPDPKINGITAGLTVILQEIYEINRKPDKLLANLSLACLRKLKKADFTLQEIKDTRCPIGLMKSVFTIVELRNIGITIRDMKSSGCSLSELKQAGFSALQIKTEGEYQLSELKDINFTIQQLKTAGYTLQELKNVGFTVTDLKSAPFTAAEMKSSGGYTLQELKDAEYSSLELKEAGYSLLELKNIGFTAKQLHDAGFKAGDVKIYFALYDLKAAGYTAKELKDGNFHLQDLYNVQFSLSELKSAQFTIAELKSLGYSVHDLKNAGFTTSEFIQAGCFAINELRTIGLILRELRNSYTVQQLKEGGYLLRELINFGVVWTDLKQSFTLAELKLERLTVEQLVRLGCTPQELRHIGCTAEELKAANFTCQALKAAGFNLAELFSARFSLRDLKAAGFTVQDFKLAGRTASELKGFGFSASDLRQQFSISELKNCFPLSELRRAGIAVSQLRTEFSPQELKQVGFTATELKATGFSCASLKAAGYSLDELLQADFSPTELKVIGFTAVEFKSLGYRAQKLQEIGFTPSELRAAGFNIGPIGRMSQDPPSDVYLFEYNKK